MDLTWKDVIATLLAVLTAFVYYVKTTSWAEVPVISGNYRWAVVILAIIGFIMCLLSEGMNSQNPFFTLLSISGVLSFAVIVYGLITGEKKAFVLLTAIILVMWFGSTVKHVIT